jgi:hypothetical protein
MRAGFALLSASQSAIVYVGPKLPELLLAHIHTAMTREQAIRVLRIAVSSTCVVIGLLLVTLWVRSYRWSDSILGLKRNTGFGVAFFSENGQLVVACNAPISTLYAVSQWEVRTATARGLLRPIRSWFGFGYLKSRRERGLGVPHWFPVLLTAVVAVAPWMRWRYSLRALLIGTTMVAVVLGVVIIAGR